MENKLLFILCPIILFLGGCQKEENSNGCYCDEGLDLLNSYMHMPRPADSYNYPIRPCMNQWKKLTSTEKKIKACQIPVDRLENMSTQAVIQALWEYPFFTEPVSEVGNRNLQNDFETIFHNNAAYKNLISRGDAGTCLLYRYKLVDAISPKYNFHPIALELLFSQPYFLSQLNTKEKKELVIAVFEKERLRMNHEASCRAKQRTTIMFMGRIMMNVNYQPFVDVVNNNIQFKRFIDNSIPYLETDEEYIELSKIINDNFTEFTRIINL